MNRWVLRLSKVAQVASSLAQLRALFFHRVLAGNEHRPVLSKSWGSVIDVGANRGQFALAVMRYCPGAQLIAFEPLPQAATVLERLVSSHGVSNTSVVRIAVSNYCGSAIIHVARSDDSSSLRRIGELQAAIFPGTDEVSQLEVPVQTLDGALSAVSLKPPCLLKLDVQGAEYEVIEGAAETIKRVSAVYCELSFRELYEGQRVATSVIVQLSHLGFEVVSIHNVSYDKNGLAIQADFLFSR